MPPETIRVSEEVCTTPSNIIEAFERIAAQQPQACAVVHGEVTLSYTELYDYAARIAFALQKLSVQNNQAVGLYLSTSLHAVAATLGCWMAGASCVPLSPLHPIKQQQQLLDDAALCAVISLNNSCIIDGARCLVLDQQSPRTLPAVTDSRIAPLATEQLAYIRQAVCPFGSPANIQIEHAALLNFCSANAGLFELSCADTTLLRTPLTFDMAMQELLPTLISGGTLVISDESTPHDIDGLSSALRRHNITSLYLSTAHWQRWVDKLSAAGQRAAPCLRRVTVSGDPVSALHYQRWLKLAAPNTLWTHAYGKPETLSTAVAFIPPQGWLALNMPVGKTLHGSSVHILNRKLQPVAKGETGDLYLGGDKLARGYLKRPDLDRQLFIEANTAQGPARLFRSGDLARRLPSGDIALMGRRDRQIEISPHRIDPRDIEHSLNVHEQVRESLVLAHRVGSHTSLLAYVVCQPKHIDLLLLARWLEQRLPTHKVPYKFIVMSQFPRTIDGQIDRRSLPDSSSAVAVSQREYATPMSATEQELASLWKAELPVEEVGRFDDFFELGGDSLMAVRTLGVLQNKGDPSMSTADFYANSKLHEQAARLDAIAAEPELLNIQRTPFPLPETALAASQLRLWLQYESNALNISLFHVHEAVKIQGALDKARLIATLRHVVARHSVLHMHVAQREDGPTMCWPHNFVLPIEDLTVDSSQDWSSCVHERVQDQRFSLDKGPLIRAHIIRRGSDHLLLLVAHHLVMDGWSMSLMLREISECYGGRSLLQNPLQFVDFARADAVARSSRSYEPQLHYWQKQLQGLEPAELNPDKRPPVARQYSAGQISFNIEQDLADKLALVSKALNSSAPSILMAVYIALLARHSNSDDLAVATIVHGRNDRKLDNVVGSFVGTLPIRARLSNDTSFAQLVQRCRDTTRDAVANSDVHFDQIVQKINPQRVDDQLPFSPYMFLMQNILGIELSLDGLHCEHLHEPIHASEYDLLLEVAVVGQGQKPHYRARIAYSDELFSTVSIQRFSEQYLKLLADALDKPSALLSELKLMTAEQQNSQLRAMNPAPVQHPLDKNIGELIRQQAQQRPDKIAVRDSSGAQLSYAELSRRADHLAAYLKQQAITPNTLVAVLMNRSCETLVALLGILRSGAAYLPLDPAYPADRISYILDDARAPLLITESYLLLDLPPLQAAVICLDCDWPLIERCARLPAQACELNNLAYVIYTSGSTGSPKGVQLSHGNLLNFLLSMQTTPGIGEDDRLLAVTTLSFDISVLELFLPLISGAELVIASRETAVDGSALANAIDSHGISVLQGTPTTWRLLIESGWRGDGRLKGLVGGEALPADILPKLLPELKSLWNMYGPTETTVWSTCQQISDAEAPIGIGRPIANTRVYVRDKQGDLCPPGIAGELCIGGLGVSSGYTNRPDLNSSQFIPDPFSTEANARLYRSGDMARWLDDGSLQYIGRLDNLVKLHGYRIELGEIESVLAKHRAVRQSAVMIREDTPGAKRLVAYWLAGANAEASEDELQDYLAMSLPAYMLPQRYVQLQHMPQTNNGKLDRKQLPAPAQADRSARQQTLATPVQADIAAQWQALLGIDSVGPEDRFFQLGGHSLLAIKFINWVKQQYQSTIPMRSMIMGTLAQIAHHIDPSEDARAKAPQDKFATRIKIDTHLIDNKGTALFCSSTRANNLHRAKHALLIVGSQGHEQSRSDRVYRELALALAPLDVTTLRLDLSGTGNSAKSDHEIISLDEWRADISCGAQYLSQLSACSTVTVLANRFSASLLNRELADLANISKAFLWDPVFSGKHWWQSRLQLQQQIAASGYFFLKPRQLRDPSGLQSPGLRISTALKSEIESFALQPQSLDERFQLLRPQRCSEQDTGTATTTYLEDNLNWNDVHASASTDIEHAAMQRLLVQHFSAKQESS